MQLSNVTVRIAGLMTNTVPKADVTPAEILVLKTIHGDDAVVDIRPTRFDKRKRSDQEYERLAGIYDRAAGGFGSEPAEGSKSIMTTLFPGALRKLPLTLEEIGIDSGQAAAAPAPVPAPDLPDADADEPEAEADADEAEDAEGEKAENPDAEPAEDAEAEAE